MTNSPNLVPLFPEIFLLIATSALLLIDMFLPAAKRNITYVLSLLILAGCALLTVGDFNAGATVYTFNNMFVSDPMSHLLKLFSYGAVAMTLIYSRSYATDRTMLSGNLGGEFYVLALFALLGQMIMISANSMLIIYLGLELMSLSLYALIALRRDNAKATEAAMKYFILGALASGFMLYGISMLYGATGTLDLGELRLALENGSANGTIMIFGLVFLVAGLAFKLGVVPFHMWVPDVYQGSPTAVTLLLGAAPKLAAFAISFRLLAEGLLPMARDWQQMLMFLAVASLAIGNFTAIAQTNLKRMLAYSTIAQMGFVLLGLMAGTVPGESNTLNAAGAAGAYGSAMFYVATYVFTTLGTFGVIMLLARSGFEAEELADFKGLAKRSPIFALIMTAFMFSLAGVPPLVGFMAKYSVLASVLGAGHLWLTIAAVLFSLVGAFYYLRVVKTMWFDEPADSNVLVVHGDMRVVLALNGVLVLVLGVMPNSILAVCASAITKTLAS